MLRISSKSQLVSFVRCYIGRISVCWNMVTSSNWKKNPRYWSFVRGIRRSTVVPLTKAIDAEFWCFLWYVPEQTVEQTVEMLVIWDAIAPFYDVTVMFLGLSSVIRSLWRDLMTSTFFSWYIKRQTGMFPGLFIKCRKHTCTEGYTGNSKQPRDIIREWPQCQLTNLELYSLNRSCHKISWSLEAARYGFRFFQSF